MRCNSTCPLKKTNSFINVLKVLMKLTGPLFDSTNISDNGDSKLRTDFDTDKLRDYQLKHPELLVGLGMLFQQVTKDDLQFYANWACHGFVSDGPKLFCPSANEFNSLANVELNVPVGEYQQPFATIGVVIPKEIGSTYSTIISRCEQFGTMKLISILADNGNDVDSLMSYVPMLVNDGKTIDDHIGRLEGTGGLDEIDTGLLQKYQRVVMNACMLLSNNSIKKIGPTNPEYEASLNATLAKKRIPDAVRAAAEKELRTLPMVYGFDQTVRIYETDSTAHDATGNGSPVKPHWRRGHWRHQPYGKEMGLRKLIFIPAVLVNAYRFAGDLANTRASYHTAEK